jgi:V/A-type H+-transporting ATPase subunit I
MEKLTALVVRENSEELLRRLMRLRAVSLIDPPSEDRANSNAPPADVAGAAARAARVDAVLPVLAKYSQRPWQLFPARVKVDPAEFRRDGRYDLAVKSVTECEKILAEQARLRGVAERARSEMQSYTPYLDFDKPLDFAGTASTVAMLGVLPGGTSTDAVLDALEGRAAVAQVIAFDTTGLYISVIAHRAEEKETKRALAGIGFLQASFPDTNGTAKQLFRKVFLQLFCILRVVQGAVQVGTTIVEGGKEKCSFGHVHHPIADAVLESVFNSVVT